jgi:hypothetical protein
MEKTLVPRTTHATQYSRLFQGLTREGQVGNTACALWCRRCCQVIIVGDHVSLTQAGYAHVLEHERSAALMRLKSLNHTTKEDSDENATRPRYRPLRYHHHG